MDQVLYAWEGMPDSDYQQGEKEDPYFHLCFGNHPNPLDDEFTNLALQIIPPLLDKSNRGIAAMPFDLINTPINQGVTRLEASAGTGKTFTLAGLFLRLLLEHKVPATEILVVTYTKAATAELRDRIRRRLREAQTRLPRQTGPPRMAWRLRTMLSVAGRARKCPPVVESRPGTHRRGCH